jgi:putative Holliday junction resolvase
VKSQRVLAVDPGEKRIGIAISDLSGAIANPLTVIRHVSRQVDAAAIVQLAMEHEAVKIVIGQPLDAEGLPGPQARRAARLAEAVSSITNLPVVLWDESGSTQEVRAAHIAMGVSRRRRGGHLDKLAAVYILQTYLDAHRSG